MIRFIFTKNNISMMGTFYVSDISGSFVCVGGGDFLYFYLECHVEFVGHHDQIITIGGLVSETEKGIPPCKIKVVHP